MRTRLDVIEGAFRRLGIKAEGEGLSADQEQYAGQVLDALHGELSTTAPQTWWPDSIDDAIAAALSNMLAVEIAASYGVNPPDGRSRAFARLMAVVRQDNRQDLPTEPKFY